MAIKFSQFIIIIELVSNRVDIDCAIKANSEHALKSIEKNRVAQVLMVRFYNEDLLSIFQIPN